MFVPSRFYQNNQKFVGKDPSMGHLKEVSVGFETGKLGKLGGDKHYKSFDEFCK